MKSIIKLIIFLGLTSTMSLSESAKAVYDLVSGDINTIEKKLIRSVNAVAKDYASKKKHLDIIVVISGDAYKFFIEDLESSPYAKDEKVKAVQSDLKSRLEALHTVHGVTFNMCETGMKARNIDKKSLYTFVNAEMMKSVYLITAQNNGYAYLPIP
jgi:uncharacterized protein